MDKMDPYQVLGVPRDADVAAIRAAYRTKAKIFHPDAETGDREKFEQLNLAHEVLIDQDRRGLYDRTGHLESGAPDNAGAEALLRMKTGLFNAIQIARSKAGQKDPPVNPMSLDILGLAKNNLVDHIDQCKSQIDELEARRAFMTELKSRFVFEGANDVIRMVLEDDIKKMNGSISSFVSEINITQGALQLFEGYDFRRYKPPAPLFITMGGYGVASLWSPGAPPAQEGNGDEG